MTHSTSDWYYPLVPTPPDWTLDWDSLMEHDWLRPLRGCAQNPIYHAEGDVETHTRMVCEALISLPEWRALPVLERNIVFLGALFHDIAKPLTTEVAEDGTISSPGHTKKGSHVTRQILWRGDSFLYEPPPLAVREMVSYLVHYSGLPIWFWQKENPARELITASMRTRLDWLALMAEADCMGRRSLASDDFPERVKYFREYASELGCFAAPYPFASDHTRFRYFHDRKDSAANHELYDDTEFEVVMMSGLPGAGKDAWIQDHGPELAVVSLDQIRRQLNIAPDEQQSDVAHAGRDRARELLREKIPFIWNATNITRPTRASLIKLFSDYKARVRIVYVEPPSFVELEERNAARGDDAVPDLVVQRLADKLDPPDMTECHSLSFVSA